MLHSGVQKLEESMGVHESERRTKELAEADVLRSGRPYRQAFLSLFLVTPKTILTPEPLLARNEFSPMSSPRGRTATFPRFPSSAPKSRQIAARWTLDEDCVHWLSDAGKG